MKVFEREIYLMADNQLKVAIVRAESETYLLSLASVSCQLVIMDFRIKASLWHAWWFLMVFT